MDIAEISQLSGLTDECIVSFETFFKIKFPKSYIDFIKNYNGGKPKDLLINVDGEEKLVDRILCMMDDPTKNLIYGHYDLAVVVGQIEDRLTDNEDLIGIELVPIISMFGGDFICLDFRNKGEPSIVLWDHNESDELSPETILVDSSSNDFFNKIQKKCKESKS